MNKSELKKIKKARDKLGDVVLRYVLVVMRSIYPLLENV